MNNKYYLKNWHELEIGGYITSPGNAADYETGVWRTSRPVWYPENCINCLTCWVLCPEDAFVIKDEINKKGKTVKVIEKINYYHCKGCGLCVRECPINKKGKVKAIDYVPESK